MAWPSRPIEERLWERVHKEGPEDCWLWTGIINSGGYGRIWQGHHTTVAHRVAWELTYGPIPKGLIICHKCDVPACCNPTHLFLGDHAANAADRCAKGRAPRGEEHHKAKLTGEDVLNIRLVLKETPGIATRKILAEHYGVTSENVAAIEKRLTWRHLS